MKGKSLGEYRDYMMHGFYSRSGQLVSGKFVSVLSFSNFRCICCRYRFLVSALWFSNQNPRVTNPMSILYISPMTDKKTTHHMDLTNTGTDSKQRAFWGLS